MCYLLSAVTARNRTAGHTSALKGTGDGFVLTGDWMLSSACLYPTSDKKAWWEVLSLREDGNGRVSGSPRSRDLSNMFAPMNPVPEKNKVSGNQVLLSLWPEGWVSELVLNGTFNGSIINGTITHYGKVDCNFTMARR